MLCKWLILALFCLALGHQAQSSNFDRLESLELATQSAYMASNSVLFNRQFKELIDNYKRLGFVQEEIWTLRRYGHQAAANRLESSVLETLSIGMVNHAAFMDRDSSVSKLTFSNGWKAVFRPGSSFKSVAEMDILAFEVDRALGFDLVPFTTVRQHEGHLGSVQLFIGASKFGRINFIDHPYSSRKLHILDFITQQLDRHERNWLLRPGGHEVAIDNNMVFGTEAWRFHKIILVKYSAQNPPAYLWEAERKSVQRLKDHLLSPLTPLYRTADSVTRAALLEKSETLLKLPVMQNCEGRLLSGF